MELLGASSGERDEAILQMWQDGMNECVCPLGRIDYEHFRMFVKGQKPEREPGTPRRKSGRKSVEGSPLVLQAVPEGTVSPQVKHQVFAKFEQMSALDSLKMPMLGLAPPEVKSKPKEIDIGFQPEPVPPSLSRTRSRSLGETPSAIVWYEEEDENDEALRRAAGVLLPSMVIGKLHDVIQDESKTPLAINKAIYSKHRELRQSVLETSRLFDQKRQARMLQFYDNPVRRSSLERRASLVMRRGTVAPSQAESATAQLSPGEAAAPQLRMEETAAVQVLPLQSDQRVDEAAKRSGRPRRPRQKTTSDLSGMLR